MLKTSRVYKRVFREIQRCEGQLEDAALVGLIEELMRDLAVRRNIALARMAHASAGKLPVSQEIPAPRDEAEA